MGEFLVALAIVVAIMLLGPMAAAFPEWKRADWLRPHATFWGAVQNGWFLTGVKADLRQEYRKIVYFRLCLIPWFICGFIGFIIALCVLAIPVAWIAL